MFAEGLKEAVMTGLLLGVKYLVAVVIVVGVSYLLFSDYQKVRSSAGMGEQAYRWIIAGVQTKHLPEDWTKMPPVQSVQSVPVPTATPTPEKK